jgi:hypothetical protein
MVSMNVLSKITTDEEKGCRFGYTIFTRYPSHRFQLIRRGGEKDSTISEEVHLSHLIEGTPDYKGMPNNYVKSPINRSLLYLRGATISPLEPQKAHLPFYKKPHISPRS